MSDVRRLEPSKALDGFFAVVREEAVRNPAFGARLLNALGFTVEYRGAIAGEVVDPIALVRQGQEKFRATFLTFDDKTLKKILADHGLASKTDIGKRKGPALVELLWERAETKHTSLFSR